MRKPTESDLVRQVLQLLQVRGVYSWRANNVAVYDTTRKRFRAFAGLRGVSDVLGVLPPHGRLLAVEAKVKPNRCTPAQEAFLAAVRERGGLALVIHDVRELEEALEGLA